MTANRESQPTVKDVARLAKVATGTVSRVVNRDPTVHPVIREAVEAAIRELDYRPSPIARNLRTGKTSILGFVLADLSNPTYLPSVPVVQELAREAGYTLIVTDSQMDRELEAKNLEQLASLRVDGIIWTGLAPLTAETRRILGKVPVVTLPGRPESGSTAFVPVDTDTAALEAVDQLLELGHRDIGLVALRGLAPRNPAVRAPVLLERIAAALRAADARLTSDASWTFDSREAASAQLPAKLTAPGAPTAVLVASALLPAILSSARDTGLRIPGDLSVVSIGDSELAQVYNPAISAILYGYAEAAAIAMQLMLELLSGQEPVMDETPKHIAPFARRGSVGPPARA